VSISELTLYNIQLYSCISTLYLYFNIVPLSEHLDDGAKLLPVYNTKNSKPPVIIVYKQQ